MWYFARVVGVDWCSSGSVFVVEIGFREQGDTGTVGSVQLIDLTEEEPEAPFAVREAGESASDGASKPTESDLWSWFGDHPVVVGIVTGVICFAIIATAISLTVSSTTGDGRDDPVAGAAISETDGGRGSFSGDSSNFTSNDPKRTGNVGAPKFLAAEEADADRSSQASIPGAPSVGDDAPGFTGGAANDELTTGGQANADSPAGDNTASDNSPGNDQQAGEPTATTGATSTTVRTQGTQGTQGSIPRPSTTRPPATTQGTTATTAGATTASTTQSTTTTSTTTTTTTTTQPPVSGVIAAPSPYSAHAIETATNFAANMIPGATSYCWRFSQPGYSSHGPFCASGTSYQLPAGALGMEPGLLTVTATATGPSVNESETITIILTQNMLFAQPRPGNTVTIGRALPVRVVDIVGAQQHCLEFWQSGVQVFSGCYGTESGNVFMRTDPIWDVLSPGSLTIRARVTGAGKVLAVDDVAVIVVS
jgi:hypothetical protein